jgi:hypothetical protein
MCVQVFLNYSITSTFLSILATAANTVLIVCDYCLSRINFNYILLTFYQGCGPGSGLDPDSVTFVDPDPYWESGSGSRGKKIQKFQWKNALFNY